MASAHEIQVIWISLPDTRMTPSDDKSRRPSWRPRPWGGRARALPTTGEPAAPGLAKNKAVWQPDQLNQKRIQELSWRWIGGIALSVLALVLVAVLSWLLLSVRRPVPLVVAIANDYRAPFGPLPMTGEDRALLLGLGRPGRSFTSPLAAIVTDASDSLPRWEAGDDLLPVISRQVKSVRPGGPARNAVVLYITAVGMVDSQGQACIVPPATGDDPIATNDEALLRVTRLLSAVRGALPAEVGIVVVLDCGREASPWPLGVDAAAFPAAVEAAVEAGAFERLWVLLPASAGQRPLASSGQGGSGFAIHFARGFRGSADTSPWGNNDGTVTLGELAAYLQTRVDEWATAVFGMRQTPVLLPRVSVGDLPLAWAGSVEPRLDLPAATPIDDWWLSERWQAAARMRDMGVSERPVMWAHYESLLLRSEQLRQAGSDYSDLQGNNDALAEQVESTLRLSPATVLAVAPDIRLARSPLEKLDPGQQQRRGEALQSLERFLTTASPQKRSGLTTVVTDSAQWLDHATDGWAWLRARLRAGQSVDHEMMARWLDWVGAEPISDMIPTQLHVVRMLVRWTAPEDWSRDPEAFATILRAFATSREVAMAWNVRLDRYPTQRVRQHEANNLLRRAIDLTFVGGPAAIAEAGGLARQAETVFAELTKTVQEQEQCVVTYDTVREQLPYLAAWWSDEQQRGAPDQRAAAAVDWIGLLVSYEEFDALFRQALVSTWAETVRSDFMELIGSKRRLLADAFSGLKSHYLDQCDFLASRAADSAATLGGLCRALAIPIAQGDLRMRMIRRKAELERSLTTAFAASPDQGAEPLPAPDPLAALTGWITVRGERYHPVVATLLLEAPPADLVPDTPAETATFAGIQAAVIRARARSLSGTIAEMNRKASEIEGRREADNPEILTILGEGASLVRRLAPLICDRPQFRGGAEPARRYLATAWHGRLLHLATMALDDFWAGVEPTSPTFCIRRARMLLEAAAAIVRVSHVHNGDVPRQQLASRIQQLERSDGAFATLDINPERIVLASPGGGEPPPGSVRIRSSDGVPPGTASVWLTQGVDKAPFRSLESSDGTSMSARIPVDIGADPAATTWRVNRLASQQLGESRTSILDMVVWFRGHRLIRGLPVMLASASRTTSWRNRPPIPTRVTARGDAPGLQAVAIIFDCSGSMGRRLPDGRTRIDAGREAVTELLRPLATAGNWNVSLWLYGHRTRWSRDQRGRYTSGLTPAGERAQTKAKASGEPFTLVPGDDVEQVLSMQALTPGVVREVESILAPVEPGGETPLYRAISEAIGTDFDGGLKEVPGHVLVVTDGANDQSGGQIVTARGVEDQLARKNSRRRTPLRVDIIGFALEADSMERAIRMGQTRDLAESCEGRFYQAADASSLARSLQDSLRVLRWQIQGPGMSPEPIQLGGSTTLPLVVPGQRRDFTAVLESGARRPQRMLAAENDTALELQVVGAGRSLEFFRYDGGTEQGLRDSRSGLLDPHDSGRQWFVGGHLASRTGDTVKFPVSIQNNDATSYSPRPAEMWITVQPQRGGKPVGDAFVFYDMTLQEGRPVPVFDLIAPNWPSDSDSAAIQAWFRLQAVAPDLKLPVADLVPGVAKRVTLAGFPDATVQLILEPPTSREGMMLTVLEEHPLARSAELPCLKVAISQGCLEAVHVTEPGTGRVRHSFRITADGGQISPACLVCITDSQRVMSGAVSTSTSTAGPLSVPVPGK